MLHEVHEVLREVFHRLGRGIGADVPGGAVGAHRATTVVGTVERQAKLPVGYQWMVMMRQGMRPFMAEQLAQVAPLIKAEFGENTRSSHGRDVNVAGGTVVLPAEAVGGEGTQPNLHLGHGVAPKAKIAQFTQHMPVSSVQPRERHKPHRTRKRSARTDCLKIRWGSFSVFHGVFAGISVFCRSF